jgi:hypothetical protein
MFSTYIGVLMTRFSGQGFVPGNWRPAQVSYYVPVVPGLSGVSLEVEARNAGGGVIAYKTNPSPEVLALEVQTAYQVAKIGAAKAVDTMRAGAETIEAFLVDAIGGIAL